MHIQAQLPGELATEEEKERIHTSGSHIGTFFVSHLIDTSPEYVEGEADFFEAYTKAIQEFLKLEPRVRAGHSFRVTIIA